MCAEASTVLRAHEIALLSVCSFPSLLGNGACLYIRVSVNYSFDTQFVSHERGKGHWFFQDLLTNYVPMSCIVVYKRIVLTLSSFLLHETLIGYFEMSSNFIRRYKNLTRSPPVNIDRRPRT
jgi:hypothetical protein